MAHGTTSIGLVVIFGVVLVPIYVMVAGWLIGRPREYKPVAIAFGYMVGITGAMLVGLAVLGGVLSLVV